MNFVSNTRVVSIFTECVRVDLLFWQTMKYIREQLDLLLIRGTYY